MQNVGIRSDDVLYKKFERRLFSNKILINSLFCSSALYFKYTVNTVNTSLVNKYTVYTVNKIFVYLIVHLNVYVISCQ